MALVYVGNATFVDKEPVDVKEHAPRHWSPRKMNPIHWYVRFLSLERATYGLAMVKKGPKSNWLDHEEVGQETFDPTAIAPLTDFGEVLDSLEKGKGWLFEEFPFTEIKDEADYDKAFEAFQQMKGMGPREWAPGMKKRESDWDGPGVYDVRDMTKHSKSVEKYEIDGMEYWADNVLDGAVNSDWESSLESLLERNA